MTTFPSKNRAAGFTVALILGAALVHDAAVACENCTMVPPHLKEYYQKNSTEIDALRKTILDAEREVTEREDALVTLVSKYGHAAPGVAVKLLEEENSELALPAANLIKDSAVMSDHMSAFKPGYEPTETQKQMIEHHNQELGTLRSALEHKNPEVRRVTAEFLVSQSDEQSLKKIQEATGKGLFTETEAIGYFSSSGSKLAPGLIQPYLESKDASIKAVAVYNAAGYEDLRPSVHKLLLEKDTPESVRISAITGLAEAGEARAILPIALSPGSAPNVAKAAAESYAKGISSDSSAKAFEIMQAKDALKGVQDTKQIDFGDAIKTLEMTTAERFP